MQDVSFLKLFFLKSIFFVVVIWAITLVFLWFRRKIEIFWKIVATLFLVFYIVFFYEQIMNGYEALMSDWFRQVVIFGRELLTLVHINLIIFWPVVLIIIFYKSDDMGAEKLLKFMSILTLLFWIIMIIYVFQDKGVNKALYEKIKDYIPFTK